MNWNEYQTEAFKLAKYPDIGNNLLYPMLGLFGETGETVEKLKKAIRDEYGIINQDRKEDIKKELGDVVWYIAAICSESKIKLQNIFDTLEPLSHDTYKYKPLSIFSLSLKLTEPLNSISNHVQTKMVRESSGLWLPIYLSRFLHILNCLAQRLDLTLEEIAEDNLKKLLSRKERGVIHGSGDDR